MHDYNSKTGKYNKRMSQLSGDKRGNPTEDWALLQQHRAALLAKPKAKILLPKAQI